MKQTVFLIEDEFDIMYAYKTALKAAHINVEPITTGKEAIEKIKHAQEKKTEVPALVLLDLVLPDVNGLEILNLVRQNEVTKQVPVFVLSNYDSDALRNMSYIKPDKSFIKSNVTPTMLVEIVKEELSKKV